MKYEKHDRIKYPFIAHRIDADEKEDSVHYGGKIPEIFIFYYVWFEKEREADRKQKSHDQRENSSQDEDGIWLSIDHI